MSKRIKFEIIPGKMCTLDPKNILDQDSTGTCLVHVLERIKYKPFGKSLWKVEDVENGTILQVPEYLLAPSGMSMVRNPPHQPVFNETDVEILESLIKLISNPQNKKYLDRLEALKEKIKVSITSIEV